MGDQITGGEPPWDMTPVKRLSSELGKGMSLIEFSSPLADCNEEPCSFYEFPTAGMQRIRNYGAIPVLAWNTASDPYDEAHVSDAGYQLRDVISGRFDSAIRSFASQAAAWGHPFFLRFDWEMNGNWFPWSEGVNGNKKGEYVAAWRHVHDIFTEVGATNATWVWCPYSDPEGRYSNLKELYPGSSYVDWTCLDGFNWAKNSANPQKLRSFDQIFSSSYRQITGKIAPEKPMLIGETASTGSGPAKAKWINEMFRSLRLRYPQVRGLVWFDRVDRGVQWPLEQSPAALRAFARGLHASPFKASLYADLSSHTVRPAPAR
jgi:hypothetical protein